MKNILWISYFAPYDAVPHAGGQIENYYIKKLLKSNNNLQLITFCSATDRNKIKDDHNNYGLNSLLLTTNKKLNIINIRRKISYFESIYNPFSKFSGTITKFHEYMIESAISKVKFIPDIIILQWTQVIFFVDAIKKKYPMAKIICIEEDVMFLSFYRQYKFERNKFYKILNKYKYNNIHKREINALKKANLVILNNPKDEKLIRDEGITNTWHWTPYFNNMIDLVRSDKPTKDIVFYGAMNRKENHDSVMWFIRNVFNRIADNDIRFVVVGNKPQKELLDVANNRIVVTGFVDSVAPYFQNALCCVAPLVMGAGVKIKVLESLSAGVPILTNDIGIEGIPAKNGKEFFYCSTADDYLKNISALLDNVELGNEISKNEKRFISENYDFKRDAEIFIKKLEAL